MRIAPADYQQMAEDIHANAKLKGFWDKPRHLDEMLMLMVSELSEALEENREGRDAIWYAQPHLPSSLVAEVGVERARQLMEEKAPTLRKPEGTVVEIADCMIRILDTAYDLFRDVPNWSIEEAVRVYHNRLAWPPLAWTPDHMSGKLWQINKAITAADVESTTRRPGESGLQSMNRKRGSMLIRALLMCEQILMEMNANPVLVINIKREYNGSRERMHGKAY